MALRLPPSGFTDRTAAVKGVRYASWLRRLGALLVDALLLYMIQFLIGIVFSFVPNLVWSTPGVAKALGYFLLFGGIQATYATLCLDRMHGQTPGMAALRIRCVPVEGHGRISLAQAIVRSVSAAIVTDGFGFVSRTGWRYGWVADLALIVAYLWPLIDAKRQTWWDHLANTVVLDEHW